MPLSMEGKGGDVKSDLEVLTYFRDLKKPQLLLLWQSVYPGEGAGGGVWRDLEQVQTPLQLLHPPSLPFLGQDFPFC